MLEIVFVSYAISFKCSLILLLTFNALHGLVSRYISEFIWLQVTDRATRQMDTHRLHQAVIRAVTLGDRAFVSAVPTLWNNLPVDIGKTEKLTSFKTEIKTFVFKAAYK